MLPKELKEDLNLYYIIPDCKLATKVLPPRSILRSNHFNLISYWIDNGQEVLPSQHEFNLLLRGSRDGFDINTMRNKCNGQGACIAVIKVKESGIIIGGYNPLGWNYYSGGYYRNNHDYWGSTTESFIFSLDDGNDLKKVKISRVTDNNCAIYEAYNTNIALNFGNSDLVINGTNGTCNQKYYESNILDTNNFSIEEMEIFSFKSAK